MRPRALLTVTTLAASALISLPATTADAITLYTNTAHTSRVPVGRVASLTSVGTITLTSGTSKFNACRETLSLTLDKNGPDAIVGTVHSSTYTDCVPFAFIGTHTTPWSLIVSGTATMVGAFTQWSAVLNNVTLDLLGQPYTGNLTGIVATQPTVATSPVCLHMRDVGAISGALFANGRYDGSYCFEGAANAYSLT
jgi:hypothetical protein